MSSPTNGGVRRSNSMPNLTSQRKADSVTIQVTEQTPLFPKGETKESTNTQKFCNYTTAFLATTATIGTIAYNAYYNPIETTMFLFGGSLLTMCCCCVRPNPHTGFYLDGTR